MARLVYFSVTLSRTEDIIRLLLYISTLIGSERGKDKLSQ